MNGEENQAAHFAVCLDNEGYEASLEVAKLHRVIPDEQAAAHGYVRVVDESGEDYAFLADRFHPIELPQAVERALLAASQPRTPPPPTIARSRPPETRRGTSGTGGASDATGRYGYACSPEQGGVVPAQ